MIQNIPYKFNPFPVYFNGGSEPPTPEPDYKSLPLTIECTAGTINVSCPLFASDTKQAKPWNGSGSTLNSLYYKKTGESVWSDWKSEGFDEITLQEGLKIEISGSNQGNLAVSWGSRMNRLYTDGSGDAAIFGNISSIFDSSVTTINIGNFFGRQTNTVKDASKLIVPYPPATTESFNIFPQNFGLRSGPLFTNTTFVNNMYNYAYYLDSQLSCVEVSFVNNNYWSFSDMFYNVNTSNGLFIKPYNTFTPTNRGKDTVPDNWIILNRMSDGSLQFAQNTTYKGNSYSANDTFPSEDDPYAWYYNS